MARKLIAGSIVLVLAAVVATPAALGWQAERIYARIVERVRADNPDVHIRIDEYQRGWLTARARYTVSITGAYRAAFRGVAGTDQRLELNGRDRISHGAWADGRPAIARIDSEIRMTEALRALGQEAIADDPVLEARSVIDLGGDTHSRFRIPDFRFDAASRNREGETGGITIEWRDVSGEASLVNGTARLGMRVGQVALENDHGARVTITGLELGDDSRHDEQGLRSGRAELSVRRLGVRGDHPEQPLDIQIERLMAANETAVAGEYAEITSLLAFERAVVNGIDLTDARVETRLGHLRREPLGRMQALMAEMQRRRGADDELDSRDVPDAEIDAALADLLRGSPRLESERLQVHTPDGRISGDVRLGFDGERDFDVDIPLTLLDPLSGRVELYVPRELVRRGLYARMREHLPRGEFGAEMDARLRRQVDQTIDLLVGARLLAEDGGRLVLRIAKEAGGQVRVNDRDITQLIQVLGRLMEQ